MRGSLAFGLLLTGCAAAKPLPFELVGIPVERAAPVRSFAIGAREVTWKEFNAFWNRKDRDRDGNTHPSPATAYFGELGIPTDFMAPDRPVMNLRWHAAMAYCGWLSRVTGDYYRLPTETEWELAARAGDIGPVPRNARAVAWHRGNSGEQTHPGGRLAPNRFGLYDMFGNVWEYCLESEEPPGFRPVVRGGSWNSLPGELAFATRRTIPREWFAEDVNLPRSLWWLTGFDASTGFRLVRVADEKDRDERAMYASRLDIRILRSAEEVVKDGSSREVYRHVWGEIRNGGDRDLQEVELEAYFLDPKGRPHRADGESSKPGRPTWNKCWPVLASSAHSGDHRVVLKPGATRPFEVLVPMSLDDIDESRVGAEVTNLRFSPD